ncbi:undecaprenyl-diphosphate phosphatase [Candidatus Nitrospira bockiana]
MAEQSGSWGLELAAILGLIEGLTEFLPVSSTGHLIIAGHLLGFTGAIADTFEVAIQLGSILAIVVYERRKILGLLIQARKEQAALREFARGRRPGLGVTERLGAVLAYSMHEHRSLWFLIGLGLAFLPAAAVGFVAHDWIERYLFTPATVAIALIAGGLIIVWVERSRRPLRVTELDQVGLKTAFLIGIAQCCALFPGISRSGATIVGGLMVGLDRRVATEYSFFLALPTMIVATLYQMLKSASLFTREDLFALAIGLLVSFVVAWAVIAAFLAFVKRHTLRGFAYYRIALGLIVLLLFQ